MDVYDIKMEQTATGEDAVVSGGDFAIAESTAAHQRNLLLCNPGEFKENPSICVGAGLYLDDENPADLLRRVSQQFMQDGMTFESLTADPASMNDSTVRPFIEAGY